MYPINIWGFASSCFRVVVAKSQARLFARTSDRASRAFRTFIFAILHQEKANKVFGKRSSRDYSRFSSRLVFHQETRSPFAVLVVGAECGPDTNQ
jgi:hypothetical protein